MSYPTLSVVRNISVGIVAASVAEAHVYVGAYRNTNVGVEDDTFRCFTVDWEEIWSCNAGLSPVGIVHHPAGVIALAWGIRKSGGYLYRIDSKTGDVVWRRKLKNPEPLAPTVIRDQVCVVTDHNLASFKIDDGKPVWSYPVDQLSYPAVAWPERSAVLMGQHNGVITCLDAREGKARWVRKIRGENGIVGRCGDLLFGAGRGGILHALDPDTGRVVGKAGARVWSNIVADGQRLFFQTAHDNEKGYRIGSVTSEKMELLWDVDVPLSYGDATFSPEPLGVVRKQLVVKTSTGPLYAIDVDKGKLSWQIPVDDLQRLDPQVAVQGVFVVINGNEIWMQAGETIYKIGA